MNGLKRFALMAMLAALLVGACAYAAEPVMDEAMMEAREAAPREAAADDFIAPGTGSDFDSDAVARQEQLIIRTGELDIVVNDTEESVAAITDLVNGMGGWVLRTNLSQRGQAKAGSMTVRVPVAQFDTALAQIKGLAIEVKREATSGEDVTEEYVDLTARLRNLEATADRVRAFLDEAQDVDDALNVNRELSQLEGEIEVIQGRRQYLSQSAAYSTIHINITPDVLAQPLEVGGWRPEGTARNALQALITTLQFLASLFIWVVLYITPVLLVIFIPAALLFRLGRYAWRRTR